MTHIEGNFSLGTSAGSPCSVTDGTKFTLCHTRIPRHDGFNLPCLQDMLEVIESCEMPTAIERWRIPQKHILLSTGLHPPRFNMVQYMVQLCSTSSGLVFLRSKSNAKRNHTKPFRSRTFSGFSLHLLILQSISPNSFIHEYIFNHNHFNHVHIIFRHIITL